MFYSFINKIINKIKSHNTWLVDLNYKDIENDALNSALELYRRQITIYAKRHIKTGDNVYLKINNKIIAGGTIKNIKNKKAYIIINSIAKDMLDITNTKLIPKNKPWIKITNFEWFEKVYKPNSISI